MNTTRFINFGKYDLSTNKVFYRNMVIVALSIGAGISALGFLGRYLTWKSKAYVAGGEILDVLGYASYTNSSLTNIFLTAAFGLLITIFAGCTFHSLRKKQGRINELTLPVSNSEKYIWHVLLCVGGGFLLAFASLLAADLVNYLLHLVVYGNDGTFSLTSRVIDIYTISMPEISDKIKLGPGANQPLEEYELFCAFVTSMKVFVFCNIFMQICAYIYGNSVKYKYNIILTYLFLTLASVAVMVVSSIIGKNYFELHPDVEGIEAVKITINCIHVGSVLMVVLGGLFIWRSYKRYTKAQVTSRLNK